MSGVGEQNQSFVKGKVMAHFPLWVFLILLGLLPRDYGISTLQCQESGLGVEPHRHVPKPNFNHSSEQTIVLLVGGSFTGTSITHFLVGMNENMATLRSANEVSPDKEGWAQAFPDDIETVELRRKNLKGETLSDDRSQSYIEQKFGTTVWKDLINNYKRLWDLDRDENGKPRPYQLECTPAEMKVLPVIIQAIRENAQLRGQRIALILLTRSPCNNLDGTSWGHNQVRRYHEILQNTKLHGGDIFLLRYEDLYLSGQPGPRHGFLEKELDAYIPGFGKLALDSRPGDEQAQSSIQMQKAEVHGHVSISANQYFQDIFLPRVPYNKFINIDEISEMLFKRWFN